MRELLVFCFRFCFCCVHCLWFVLSVSLFVVLLFCFCLCCSVLFSSWACSAAPPLVFDRIPWTAPWPKPANCGASLISDRPGHQTNWTNPCPNKSCELRACRRSRPAGQLLSKRYQRSQGVGSLHKLRRQATPCTAHETKPHDLPTSLPLPAPHTTTIQQAEAAAAHSCIWTGTVWTCTSDRRPKTTSDLQLN